MLSTVVWILIGALATGLPALFVARYLHDARLGWLLACAVSYTVLVIAYLQLFSTGALHTLYPIVKVVSILLVVLGGMLLFGERIGGKDLLGIGCAIAAIGLLSA